MLSGIGPADHLRDDRHQRRGRPAGRQEPAGSSRGDHHVRAAERKRVPPRHALRPHGGQHDPRLSLRHRPRHRGAGRAACLRQDAARARRARHRVHVPRRAGATRICGFRCCGRPMSTATASARPCCIPTAAARCCCARPIRATRRASSTTSSPRRTICRACARASSARARSPTRSRWTPYRGVETSPGDAVKTDAEIDAFIRQTAITAHHPCGTCAMGIGAGHRHRSATARARRRGPARGRRLGHARPRLRAHQRLRADDGREGLRHDPTSHAAAGGQCGLIPVNVFGPFTRKAPRSGRKSSINFALH